jgi:hypothetical protein
MPIIALIQIIIFSLFYKHFKSTKLFLFLIGWVFSYLIFAFLWNNGGNIFWFQTIPAITLIYAYCTQNLLKVNHNKVYVSFFKTGLLLIPFLAITLNTIQTIAPTAFFDMNRGVILHSKIIKEGDLEITTGWDKYKWINKKGIDVDFKILQLMNMATKNSDDPEHISKLSDIVQNHLVGGNRVIVARLYNTDSTSSPWYNLARMDWPRKKIKGLLGSFCNREIHRIDDVVFHEVFLCDNS